MPKPLKENFNRPSWHHHLPTLAELGLILKTTKLLQQWESQPEPLCAFPQKSTEPFFLRGSGRTKYWHLVSLNWGMAFFVCFFFLSLIAYNCSKLLCLVKHHFKTHSTSLKFICRLLRTLGKHSTGYQLLLNCHLYDFIKFPFLLKYLKFCLGSTNLLIPAVSLNLTLNWSFQEEMREKTLEIRRGGESLLKSYL